MKNLFNIHQGSEFAESLVKLLGQILESKTAKFYLTCTYDALEDRLYVTWDYLGRARLDLVIERHGRDLLGDLYNISGQVRVGDASFEVITQPQKGFRIRVIHLGDQFDTVYKSLVVCANDQHKSREPQLVTVLDVFSNLVVNELG